jgi:hypothetical protein
VSSQHCVCGVCFSSPSHNSQYSHNTEPADSILFCELCAFCDTLVALDQDFEYRCELLGAVTDVASWRRTDVAPSCSFKTYELSWTAPSRCLFKWANIVHFSPFLKAAKSRRLGQNTGKSGANGLV